jgi:hypothetical protein
LENKVVTFFYENISSIKNDDSLCVIPKKRLSSILTHIIKNNIDDIKHWVNENDMFIVDRGFRDALPLIEEIGLKGEMPKFLKKGEKQMLTEDANLSRLVTKAPGTPASSTIKKLVAMI